MKKLTFVLSILILACAKAAFAKDSFTLTSPDLPEGKPFPAEFIGHDYGCTGPGHSPSLNWKGEPAGTKSFAITMYDSYRPPASGWWHWLVYNLPASTHSLPQDAGAPGGKNLPAGAKHGHADADVPEARYYGPCPDVGDKPHHYIITVYALKVDHLDIPDTATGAVIDYDIAAKVLGKAVLDRTLAR
jgi:Raf kinase inhibitor-like YbhB/YbcL family protein